MKQPAISRQIVLPWRASLVISYTNLRVRFTRSMITISSLILAVAFVAFVLINTHIATGMLSSGDAEAVNTLLQEGYRIDNTGQHLQAGAKERWIVFLSLLVCVVGIINAQLMAVTGRFREIGIMKCLGALDSIIVRLFLLEATLQGIAGAIAGAILGMLTSMLLATGRFGLTVWTVVDWGNIAMSFTQAVATGLVLSLVGVAYPAFIAARMRPVAALRARQ